MMHRFLILAGLAVAATAMVAGSAFSEIKIRLKSGATYTLPIDQDDIESITFGSGGTAAAPVAKRPAAKAQPRARPAPPARAKAVKRKRVANGVILVGPRRLYRRPSDAAKVATDGDVIKIDAAEYVDEAIWRANDLTIIGVGGRPHIIAPDRIRNRKAIWVIGGRNTRIDNLEFSGARVGDRNGAALRLEGPGLTLVNSFIHDNEMGILAGGNPVSDIVITGSEFYNNGRANAPPGIGHQLYIGAVRSLTLRNSYLHHGLIGHQVKSRAKNNFILYNRIMDEESGTSSYLIEFPNGGNAYVIGNLLQQGRKNDNFHFIRIGVEGDRGSGTLYVGNNTMVNDFDSGVFVANATATPVRVVNNIMVGPGTPVRGAAELAGNVIVRPQGLAGRIKRLVENAATIPAGNRLVTEAGFADRAAFDYRLTAGSPAIDAGVDPGKGEAMALIPDAHYVHPTGAAARRRNGAIDAGAYEFAGPVPTH